MGIISNAEYTALENSIYELLIQDPKRGRADISICREAAEDIVHNWVVINQIEVTVENKYPNGVKNY